MSESKVIEFPTKKEVIKSGEEVKQKMMEKRKEAISKLPRFRGEIPSKTVLRGLPDVKPGEIFWISNDNKAYLVTEKEGKKITIKALDETATLSTGITIFEMNKQIISKEPVLEWTDKYCNTLRQRLISWFNKDTKDEFYLLYGRDIHYVTLIRPQGGLQDPVINLKELLDNVGETISIDFNTSDSEPSIEIWVRTATSLAELLYLFPFDRGVVSI